MRSMYDHSWGGSRFYLLHPTEDRLVTEASFLSGDGARSHARAMAAARKYEED